MALKIFLALCALTYASADLQTVNGRIKITVGTTSGCGDTVSFINNQLVEAYSVYRDFLDVEFVPWGRTEWHDNGTITCQFLQPDCWANRLHRCALNMLEGNQDAQLHYMTCEFNPPYPSFSLGTYLCAQSVGLNLVNLDNCVVNAGDDLDRAAQEAAREPMDVINFVPHITFNDQVDVQLHSDARQRLTSLLCFALAADPSTGVTNCSL